jgi:hypothetical protein
MISRTLGAVGSPAQDSARGEQARVPRAERTGGHQTVASLALASKQRYKQTLTNLGRLAPLGWLYNMRISLNYMLVGKWMATHDFRTDHRHADRSGVFAEMAQAVGHRPVLYLEFGVHEGASLREWCDLLTHPETRLEGFDSFQGMPDEFDPRNGITRGHFDVGGIPPTIDDERVSFHVGWFDDVLPSYEVPEHERLVVTLDADLYSSTKVVLDHLQKFIVPGTLLYFDNLSQPDHELRAFHDFMEGSGRRFRLMAADLSLNCAAFECVG